MSDRAEYTFFAFVFSNLKRRPFRTVSLVFLVTVLSFVLFVGSFVTFGLQNGADGLSKRLGADILVVPMNASQKTRGILLRGEPSTFYLRSDWVDKIAKLDGVKAASSQLFIASLNADCCAATVQIIGFDQKTDFLVEPWVKIKHGKALAKNEIIVGANISDDVGQSIKFFERQYNIVGKLDTTGTGFDNSIFLSIEAAKRAAQDSMKVRGMNALPDDSVSSVSILVKKGYSAKDVAYAITRQLDEKEELSVIVSETFLGTISGSLRSMFWIALTAAIILWVMCVLVLGIISSVILNERKREFGILRSLGATRGRLSQIVLAESVFVGLFGGVIGILFSLLFLLPFGTFIKSAVGLPYLQPNFVQLKAIIIGSLLFSFLSGPAASFLSVLKISRSDAYAVIRQGEL